jgi:hypothetical protein
MNDIIRDLALEASVEYIASPVWSFTDAELEKFAQLIVRECARKIDDMIDNGWYADTSELKKHFGVEE